jgi:tripartite-type tricarboxylate transporter receptor subunit TctC
LNRNAAIYDKLNFKFVDDIAPLAGIVRVPLVMEVHPSIPAQSVTEFIYAKANPGKINMGTAGVGTPHHVAGELFKMMARVDMLDVPYRGSGPMLTDLLGGQVQVAFDTLPSSIEHIRAGRLRPFAVTTAAPSEVLPGVPTVAEILPGFEASAVNAIGTPRKTPTEIIPKLNREINSVLADPKLQAQLADLGGTSRFCRPMTSED